MRNLVVCADGTWKAEYTAGDGRGNTNVVKLKNALAATAPGGFEQQVFYDPGVGVGEWWKRWTGGAFGSGLSENVLDCYAWLIETYQPGDQLFFFGFSRGAYTVRSLAGMVGKCGILLPENKSQIKNAYDFYRRSGEDYHPNSINAQQFRREHSSRETRIRCLGVWDTVGSLGIPTRGPVGWWSRRRQAFHDVRLSSHVENGFHALAIDERRGPFAPTLWEVRESDVKKDGHQRIEQRWFAGVHSNVGGGYDDCGLSDLTLQWMIERAESCGLAFRPGWQATVQCSCTGTLYDSMTPWYRMLGTHERQIAVPRRDAETDEPVVTYEVVDDSAAERSKAALKPPYAPRNLLDYRRRYP